MDPLLVAIDVNRDRVHGLVAHDHVHRTRHLQVVRNVIGSVDKHIAEEVSSDSI